MHEKGEKAIGTSRHAIQDKPFMSMAVAFGAGLLTAFLLERNHK